MEGGKLRRTSEALVEEMHNRKHFLIETETVLIGEKEMQVSEIPSIAVTPLLASVANGSNAACLHEVVQAGRRYPRIKTSCAYILSKKGVKTHYMEGSQSYGWRLFREAVKGPMH